MAWPPPSRLHCKGSFAPGRPSGGGEPRAGAAYPEYDWATLAVWAWGGMRVVDYLETRDDVDLDRIAITGHSRGGKMALLAGALDERFALVAPNGSGAGGAGSYRVLGPGAESLGMNDKPHWYHERLRAFAEREDRLPFDQHFLAALVPPRALSFTESLDDAIANPLGTQLTALGARRVYDFLGVPPRVGIHFRRGGHDFGPEDWRALETFARWHFFDRPPADPKAFWRFPLPLPAELVKGLDVAFEPELSSPPAPPGHGGAARARGESAAAGPDFVLVGDPGNPPDEAYFGWGPFGAVDHPFRFARRQVTKREYAEFLSAVATESDPHGLWSPGMAAPRSGAGGITRAGRPGAYRYRVYSPEADTPVTGVSWFDAARYANWLHNGRPEGPPSPRTTEDGAYELDRKASVAPARRAAARFHLPSENEWYKAAYHTLGAKKKQDRYQLFTHRLFEGLRVAPHREDEATPWGALEMHDRIWEWTDSPAGPLFRAIRSGAWFQGNNRQAAGRFYSNPELELANVGFRIAAPVSGSRRRRPGR